MAIDGQHIRSMSAVVRTLGEATTSMAEWVARAQVQGLRPQASFALDDLVRIGDDALDGVVSRARSDLAWIDDGWCPARAEVVAQLADNAALGPAATAAIDRHAGAVVVADGSFRFPGATGTSRRDYHAAAVVWPESSSEPLAIDFLLFKKPVPLRAWAQRLGNRLEEVEVRHPHVPSGLGVSSDPMRVAERTYDDLLKAARSVSEPGRPIDNPILRGAPIRRVREWDGTGAGGRAAAFDRYESRYERASPHW